jgi:vitamin B12 transporter
MRVINILAFLALVIAITALSEALLPEREALAQGGDNLLDTVVVTTNLEGEPRHKSPSSIWVIEEDDIRREHVGSAADLIANYSAGMVAESGGPTQAFIKLRGAQTNGQGRDWLGDVLILVNGRRSGTGNLSKISTADIERVEILKGPSSVMYGSQALGGVVNIILKNSRNTKGGKIEAKGGSFGMAAGHAEYGSSIGEKQNFSAMAAVSYSRRDAYKAGRGSSGTQGNSNYNRWSGLASFAYEPSESLLVSLDYRKDGVYDSGFGGSGGGQINKDSRSSDSADLVFDYRPENSFFDLKVHAYYVHDLDDFDWTYQLTPDLNKRNVYVLGAKIQPLFKIGDINEIRVGLDLERSEVDSTRVRYLANGQLRPAQVAPYDNNQVEMLTAFYLEDTARLIDDRLIIRAGIRRTRSELELKATPNAPGIRPGKRDFSHTSWSVGANFALNNFLNLRAGAATGFKTPSASQLAGEVVTGSGTTTINTAYGSGDLKPESSFQYEIGLAAHGAAFYADLVWFKNTISDRIDTELLRSESLNDITYNYSKYINNVGDAVISGLEFDGRLRIDKLTDLKGFNLTVGFMGNYNLKSEDKGESTNSGPWATKVACVYDYQATLFFQLGKDQGSHPWSTRLSAVIRGPMYNNTGETMKRPEFEPDGTYVHKKDSFTVWNMSGEFKATENITIFGGVNNILDLNEHPFWWGLDKDPWRNLTNFGAPTQGSHSMPGREFYAGARFTF